MKAKTVTWTWIVVLACYSYYYSHNNPTQQSNTTSSKLSIKTGTDGQWVWVGRNRTFESPTCCNWPPWRGGKFADAYIEHLQSNNCKTTTDKDFELLLYHGDPVHPSPRGGCVGSGVGCDNFFDEYEWQSSELPPFDANRTCHLLGEKRVLLIGDSTSQQTASTIMNALPTCNTQIYHAISDTLVNMTSFGGLNRGKAWKQWVEEVKPDIVVLSVGAHIKTNDTSYEYIIDRVLDEIELMRKVNPNIKFAWRTQAPAGCAKYPISPDDVTKAAEMSMQIEDYNHGRFYHRDTMLVSKLDKIGIPFLDLRMLYSRMDGHRSSQNYEDDAVSKTYNEGDDCLHWCNPGPLDIMARLFQKLLMNTTSK